MYAKAVSSAQNRKGTLWGFVFEEHLSHGFCIMMSIHNGCFTFQRYVRVWDVFLAFKEAIVHEKCQ